MAVSFFNENPATESWGDILLANDEETSPDGASDYDASFDDPQNPQRTPIQQVGPSYDCHSGIDVLHRQRQATDRLYEHCSPTTNDVGGSDDLVCRSHGMEASPPLLHGSFLDATASQGSASLYINSCASQTIDHEKVDLLRYFKTAIGRLWVSSSLMDFSRPGY